MRRMIGWGLTGVLVLVLGTSAADGPGGGKLERVESVPRDELDAVVSAAVSADGRFVYAASWRAASLTVLDRDPVTGAVTPKLALVEPTLLAGATGFALSPDGKHAIATAFQSRTAVLLDRDPASGALTVVQVARDGEAGVRMQWPVDAAFSPDGKFAYVLDDQGSDGRPGGAVLCFRVDDGKLAPASVDVGLDGCYAGARGLTFHPDGRTLYVAAHRAGALVVADRDPANGATSVRQVIKDEEGPVHGLAGAMGVVTSPDGRDVYVSAGRFSGDDAVTAFRLGSDGRLDFLQEWKDGEGGLRNFLGGNHLIVSPDGLDLYVAATRSRSVAWFRRDPATGQIRPVETIPDGGEGGEVGAAGLAISPDGRSVYAATEDGKSLTVFRRSPPPGP